MPSVELPSEIWINILSFLNDFSTLYNFAQTSNENYQIVESSSNLLHYFISANIRLIEPCTFGSASTIYPSESKGDDQKTKQETELAHLLSKAILDQMTMMKSCFEHVKTWKDFAKIRVRLEKNWRSGNGRWTTITRPTNPPSLSPVWRFKFDPEFNYWAAVDLSGIIEVFSPIAPGHYRRLRVPPRRPASSTHLESSGPFIVTNWRHQCFQVWKRIEGAFEGTVPAQDEPWPYRRIEYADMQQDEDTSLILEERDSCPIFKFHCYLNMPIPAFCFKARAPYLAAGSYLGQRIYVWDLETGKLVEEYDVSGRESDDMTYIDFDSRLIFLASSRHIHIYDRVTRQSICFIPPRPVEDLEYYADKTHDVIWPIEYRASSSLTLEERKEGSSYLYDRLLEWVAVHYDYKNGHLVAISQEGFLIWVSNYRQTFLTKNSASNREDFVVLYNGGACTNLCVENGRAAFSTIFFTSGGVRFESLFALELTKWSNHSDFMASPPRLTNLAKIIPSVVPISRLEMDSCAIYATVCDARSDPELCEAWQTLQYDHNEILPLISITWMDLDGKALYSHEELSQNGHTLPISFEEFEHCWEVWENEQIYLVERQPTDILAYSLLSMEDLT